MSNKRVALWMSEKKLQKINWLELERTFKEHGFTLFKVN